MKYLVKKYRVVSMVTMVVDAKNEVEAADAPIPADAVWVVPDANPVIAVESYKGTEVKKESQEPEKKKSIWGNKK